MSYKKQAEEVKRYLHRYQINANNIKIEDHRESLSVQDLHQKACASSFMKRKSVPIDGKNFLRKPPSIAKSYIVHVGGALSLIGTGLIIGVFLLVLSIQQLMTYTPWDFRKFPSLELEDKLFLFKNFLDFQKKYPPFSLKKIRTVFEEFQSKLVVTALFYEAGRWKITFILNPSHLLDLPHLKKALTTYLTIDQWIPSSTQPHEYTLECTER